MVDEAILRRMVEEASGRAEIVGQLTTPAEGAVSYLVVVSANELAAYLVLGQKPARGVGQRRVLQAIKDAGVVSGVDRRAVEAALANWVENSAVRIARGAAPVNGEDAWLFEIYSSSQSGLEEQGDTADFFRTRLAEPVRRDRSWS